MKLHHYIASLLILFFLAGCEGNLTKPNEKMLHSKRDHGTQKVDSGKIDGMVSIVKNTRLPESAVLTITLADTSMMDLPALILSQKYYTALNNRQSIPFELTYLKNEVRPDAKITISASVSADGQLLYLSNTAIEVINNGIDKNVDVLVVPAN